MLSMWSKLVEGTHCYRTLHNVARRIDSSLGALDLFGAPGGALALGDFMPSTMSGVADDPRSGSSPRVHLLTMPHAIVIVAALVFAGFLCIRGAEPQAALATTVFAVGALVLVVVVPRGVVELVGILRELVRSRNGDG
jgi:hypothetical protein